MLKTLGKYEVLGELGRGAMGIVYCARDPIINRLVALKTITTTVAADPFLLQRFYREAQSAGGLQHPNIVTIYDMGDDKGIPYIAMELVEGQSFEHMIAHRTENPISLKLVYAMQACRAFDYAHKRGIVHRDIKPANIMVTKDGTVKVVDFGIARVLEASKTQTGTLIGTFAYMSPEQYQGEHADERSDIWSFGVLLFELLCYQSPFAGETPASLMHNICTLEPAPLPRFVPNCPDELEAILSKILRKSPAQRYQSMEDLLGELEPLCKRLQAQSESELVAQSRRFIEQNQFCEARDVLRLALQVESGNQRVRSMLEEVNGELKRILVRPKAEQLVEKGRALLAEGKVQDARIVAANALGLDSNFGPAQDLQLLAQKQLDRAQLIAGWLEEAKQHLAEGLPEEAEPLLAQVLRDDPSNTLAASLQQQVSKEKAERQRRLRLLEQLQHARELWTQLDYALCIHLLLDLANEFPNEEEISRLSEIVREDQEEERRHVLQNCRNFLDAARYDECFALLAKLQEQFPQDDEVAGLLENARKNQSGHRKSHGLMDAKGLLVRGQYDQGISLLNSLLGEFPDEPEIAALLETAQQDQREQHRQQGLTKARELLAARLYQECASLLMSMKKEYPGDDQIQRLLTAVTHDQVEPRKREGLARARSLLASRRYDESIAILSELQADFPSEAELNKLLETARADRTEQQKQQELAQARAHLAAQSFSEAISLLDALAAAHPQDTAVLKLRAVARREQEKNARAERIQLEQQALKRLLSEKRYSEVISKAKQLLTEFPGEGSFKRLAEFALSRQESIEREGLLRGTLEEVKALFTANRFKDAILTAQAGLRTFPGEPELLDWCQQAEIQERKVEIRQQIEGRVRDIRVKINCEKFSEAIDLAKETLSTFGPDTDVSQLLNSAEVELDSREKKREELRTLETIRTLIDSGDFEGANRSIEEAIKAKTLEPFDPRIQRLSEQVENAKSATAELAPSLSCPPSFSREYVFLQGPPSSPPPAPDKIFLKPISTGQGAAAQPALSPQSAAPTTSSQSVILPQAVLQPLPPDAVRSTEAPPSTWRRTPALITALVVALSTAAWVGLHSFLPSTVQLPAKANASPEPSKPNMDELQARESDALNAAGKLLVADDLAGARKALEEVVPLNGPLTSQIRRKTSQIDESLKDPGLRKLRRGEEQLWQRALKRVDEKRFMDAQTDLHQLLSLRAGGVHREDAQRYLDKVIPQQTQERDLIVQAHLDLSEEDFSAARYEAEKLTQNGSDATQLLLEIDRTEQSYFAQLQAQFDEFKQRDDDAAVQGLNALWPKFQALAAVGGRRSGKALSYMNEIPVAMSQVQARMQETSADAVFQRMVQRYRRAAAEKDTNSLAAARTDFESIVQGGGPHAIEAQSYLADVKGKLETLGEPFVQTPKPPAQTQNPDAAAIQAIIHRYSQAFELRDADALRQVWPVLGGQYDGYKSWFANTSSIRMHVDIESLTVSAETAVVKGQVRRERTPLGSKTTISKYSASFHLAKRNGAWFIDEVELGPES